MKKLIALFLVLTMAVSFMACAAKEEAPAEEEEEEIVETPEVEEEPAIDEPAAMPDEPAMDEPAVMPEVDGPAAMPEVEPGVEEEMPVVEYMPEEKLNEMTELMDKLVGGINDELMVGTMEITSDMYEYYGIPAVEGVHAVVSMPMIGSIAHEVLLIEVPEGTDAEAFAAEVEGLLNPMKWVCVQPETTWVKASGNYVVSVMSAAEMADAVLANFNTVFAG